MDRFKARKEKGTILATVRVVPKAREDSDAYENAYDDSLDFEYSDYDVFNKWLQEKKGLILDFAWEGNAFSLEALNKKVVTDFKKFVESKTKFKKSQPFKIGIEWNYWQAQ